MISQLSNTLAALPESLDQEQFLWQAVEMIANETGLYLAAVYLIDFNDGVFYFRAGNGHVGRILHGRGHRVSIHLASVRHTILSNRITLIDQFEDTLSLFSILHDEQGTATLSLGETEKILHSRPRTSQVIPGRWWLSLPLRNETGLIGILQLFSEAPSAFTADEILTFQLAADQIGARITNTA